MASVEPLAIRNAGQIRLAPMSSGMPTFRAVARTSVNGWQIQSKASQVSSIGKTMGRPRVAVVAAMASAARTVPRVGESSDIARPRMNSAISVICAATAVVSCIRAIRPKVAIRISSPESAIARAKSVALAPTPSGSLGATPGRRVSR